MATPSEESRMPSPWRPVIRSPSRAKAMAGITAGMVAMIKTPLIAVVECSPW